MRGLRIAGHVVFYIQYWDIGRIDIIRILSADETFRSNHHWVSERDEIK